MKIKGNGFTVRAIPVNDIPGVEYVILVENEVLNIDPVVVEEDGGLLPIEMKTLQQWGFSLDMANDAQNEQSTSSTEAIEDIINLLKSMATGMVFVSGSLGDEARKSMELLSLKYGFPPAPEGHANQEVDN